MQDQTGRNEFEALRFIGKKAGETSQAWDEKLAAALTEQTWDEFDAKVLASLEDNMWGLPEGREYMHSRGFEDDTIKHFKVGYSAQQKMVTVPLHNPVGLPVGIVGRSIQGKDFKNSKGLPRNRTLFNLHRAKRIGDIAILTEASFDAMRLHQAGFPNGVAVLGGTMSPENFHLLDRHFGTIIIMTDFDKTSEHINKGQCNKCNGKCRGHNPGRDLGRAVAYTLRSKNILWASYDYKMVYPHGAKDAGDLTDDEIRQCINNAVPTIVYQDWNLYYDSVV